MPLLPVSLNINDPFPILGSKVEREVEKVPDLVAMFERCNQPAIIKTERGTFGEYITEADCRQPKSYRFDKIDEPASAPSPQEAQLVRFKVGDLIGSKNYADTRGVITKIDRSFEGRTRLWGFFTDEHCDGTTELFIWEENARLIPHQSASPEGWIEHRGGRCPVLAGTKVRVKLRNGFESEGNALEESGCCVSYEQWLDEGTDVDIVAYKVISK